MAQGAASCESVIVNGTTVVLERGREMDQRHSESPARTRRSNAKLPSQLRPPSYRRVQDLKRAAGHLEHVSMQLGRACALVLAPFKIGSLTREAIDCFRGSACVVCIVAHRHRSGWRSPPAWWSC